jgi:hypothetical protein
MARRINLEYREILLKHRFFCCNFQIRLLDNTLQEYTCSEIYPRSCVIGLWDAQKRSGLSCPERQLDEM